MKKCFGPCDSFKAFESFNKNKNKPDGLQIYCKECRKKYREEHREEISARKKEYYKKNKKKINEKNNDWYYRNHEQAVRQQKAYATAHKKERNNRANQRYKDDITFRMKVLVSNAVRKSLKKFHGQKNNSVTKSLPYTMQQLKEHLQSQFDDKMSWENHGTYWHIDHVIPQSALPYDSMEHPNFLKCWDLNNLRPLEAIENIRKRNKY